MRQFNLSFKIKLSKKQEWEMSQLESKYHLPYLLSFVSDSGFKTTYTNCSQSWSNTRPFDKIRWRPIWGHGDVLRNGVINWCREKLDRQRRELINKLSVTELRKLTGRAG